MPAYTIKDMALFSLSEENKVVLIKRSKSLVWRAGAMLAVLLVDFVAENLGLFDMPGSLSVLLGLVLGEVSKFLNKKPRGGGQ